MDMTAVDADVVKLARRHAAEFRNGLAILPSVVERRCDVHDGRLSVGLETSGRSTALCCFDDLHIIANGLSLQSRRLQPCRVFPE